MRCSHAGTLAIAVLVVCVVVQAAMACDFPPQGFLDRPRTEFQGQYVNSPYGYSVTIPDTVTGYSGPSPGPQHGFGIVLGEKPQSYIYVNGEWNSAESVSPFDDAVRHLDYFPKHKKTLRVVSITKTKLGGAEAAVLVVTYTCPGSPEHYTMSSTFALQDGKVFEATLYCLASRCDRDRPVFQQILKSWKFIGEKRGGKGGQPEQPDY